MSLVACLDCAGPLLPIDVHGPRGEGLWCDSCRVTRWITAETFEPEADDPCDLTLNPSLEPEPCRNVSAILWFGRDEPPRIRRSRLLVERDRLVRDRLAKFNVQVGPWRRPLALVEQHLREAEDAVKALASQSWHSDGLTSSQLSVAAVMSEGRENHGRCRVFRDGGKGRPAKIYMEDLSDAGELHRDYLRQGGSHVTDLPTGNPPGPRPKQLTDGTRCEITEWLERSLEKPIQTIREYVGKGKKSPVRDALAELVRRSSTNEKSASDVADVLGIHRNTVTRWRNAARSPIRGESVSAPTKLFDVSFESEAERRLELLRAASLASSQHAPTELCLE